jgi:hypothetical protein
MRDTVTTNAATILTMLALWGTLTWAVTYMYMGNKIKRLSECINVLDWCVEYADQEIDALIAEKRETERVYGHVMDDYTEYYLTEKGWDAL